mmetsp:Transcript_26211/g.47981  ORF Transcript_26211/g.47981 Transcript_26211/m.47981 type:complete len:207 (-) Transcript_26211:751-1371(-)
MSLPSPSSSLPSSTLFFFLSSNTLYSMFFKIRSTPNPGSSRAPEVEGGGGEEEEDGEGLEERVEDEEDDDDDDDDDEEGIAVSSFVVASLSNSWSFSIEALSPMPYPAVPYAAQPERDSQARDSQGRQTYFSVEVKGVKVEWVEDSEDDLAATESKANMRSTRWKEEKQTVPGVPYSTASTSSPRTGMGSPTAAGEIVPDTDVGGG